MLQRVIPSTIGPAKALMLAAFSLMCAGSSTSAAVLIGSVNTSPPASVNLTTNGTLDWAAWGTTGNTTPGTASMPVLFRKDGGLNAFSEITPARAGQNVRGGTASTELFTYTDGINNADNQPATLTNSTMGSVFSTVLNQTTYGVKFDVAGSVGTEYQLQIWATGQNGVGTLTATLNGATPVSLVSQTYGDTKIPTLFTINYKLNSESDRLFISYVLTTEGAGTNSQASIQAATISAVPEPGVAGLLMLGMSFVGLRRRRR